MSFDPSAISWDFGQGDQQPPPAPMPDNINWGNVFGQVGTAMDNGADFINNNPGKVYAPPPPPPFPKWVGNSDAPQEDHGEYDRGFAVPQPTSPNDTQFGANYTTDFGKITQIGDPYNRYNSYWTPTPPQPTEFSPLEQFQQDLWRGINDYQYIQPDLPPVPLGTSW